MGSRACVVPFFHIDPLNKGLGDEEEATRTPSPSPPPQAATGGVRTGTTSWDRRERKKDWAERGYDRPLMKAMCYQARKTANANARKEWVLQHGMAVPVPQSLWPKLPTGEWKPWVPPEHWMTLEQVAGPICEKYAQQFEILNANYLASVDNEPEWVVDEEESSRPWRVANSGGQAGGWSSSSHG